MQAYRVLVSIEVEASDEDDAIAQTQKIVFDMSMVIESVTALRDAKSETTQHPSWLLRAAQAQWRKEGKTK